MPRTITIDLDAQIQKLETDQRKLRDQADEIVARIISEDREFTKDEETAVTEAREKIVALGKRADALKAHGEIRTTLEKPGESRTQPRDSKPPRRGGAGGDAGGEDGDEESREHQKRYAKAFNTYLRRGMTALSEEERSTLQEGYSALPADDAEVRALSAVGGAAGGFTVPQGFISTVDVAMKDFSGVRKTKATILTTDAGNDLPYPTVNDTNNEGEQVEENQATPEGDLAFGQIMFKSYLFSSRLVLVPIQLIQDTGVNIEQLLARLLGERLGRITNRRFTTGNNANQPQGVVTGSTLGKTAAGAAAVTYNELVDLQHSVDPAYRDGAEWMFHDNTFAALRKLVDGNSRPIWQPSFTSSMGDNTIPSRLLDAPYAVNNHMAQMASGNRSIVFGQMSKYHIRQVRNLVLVRLTERFAEKFQVGFFAFLRADGRLVDAGTNPVKHLVHP